MTSRSESPSSQPSPAAGVPAEPHHPAESPAAFPSWLPWVVAAAFAVVAGWIGQLYLVTRAENARLRDEQTLASFELRTAHHQLEAGAILTHRQIADAQHELAALRRQIESSGTELAQLHLVTLTAPDGSSRAWAVVAWDSARQTGLLAAGNLPAPAADQDYQLWVNDPDATVPVSAGVFPVDAAAGTSSQSVHPAQPVRTAAGFTITLERKGGADAPAGPVLLRGK